jgi:N-acetylmuramoyl-L-alanine amidase
MTLHPHQRLERELGKYVLAEPGLRQAAGVAAHRRHYHREMGRLRVGARRTLAALGALLLTLILVAGAATGAPNARVPKPKVVWKPIPFGAVRKAEMAAYAKRHYGIDSWRLQSPHVIVEHYTANESFSATWNTFAANSPDPELRELPGDCAHFVIDTDGTIYQLVPLTTMCRHTVGLNYTAIGIEHVGTSDQEILSRPRQLRASLALSLWLMQRYGISLRNVIGHNESLQSPYHRELYAPWRCQTHGDWTRADMTIYRNDLRALASRYHLTLGRQPPPRSTGC